MDPIIQHSLYILVTFIAGTVFGIIIKNRIVNLTNKASTKWGKRSTDMGFKIQAKG